MWRALFQTYIYIYIYDRYFLHHTTTQFHGNIYITFSCVLLLFRVLLLGGGGGGGGGGCLLYIYCDMGRLLIFPFCQ